MKFLFDNGMPHPLANALRLLSKPVVHVRDIAELGPGAPDPLIMQYSGNNGFLVISRDLAQAKEPWFRPSILQSKTGYFLLRAATVKGVEPHAWEICKLMIKAWDDIERYGQTNALPFLALIKPNGRVVSYK